jgi:DNA-binding MarR family transcriptional regulator
VADLHRGAGATGAQALGPRELGAYFALMEAVSLLQHQVEQHLRADGGISYVQFQLLARLASADGPLTMTELADGVVYSRSGLTYQAGLLERAGLITRGPSSDDDRATLVTITCPATSRSAAACCSTPCPPRTCTTSATS